MNNKQICDECQFEKDHSIECSKYTYKDLHTYLEEQKIVDRITKLEKEIEQLKCRCTCP